VTASISARTARATSTVLAFDCFRMPRDTCGRRLKRATERSFSSPSSARPTCRRRTGTSSRNVMTRSLNASGVGNSPAVFTTNSRRALSMRPDGISTFSRRSAATTSVTVSWYAASRSASRRTRTAKRFSPPMMIEPTPGSRWRRSFTTVSAYSVSCRSPTPSALTEIHMIAFASRSTLLTTGSSASSGSWPRTRAILSRTSFAAVSMSRSSSNSIVIRLTFSVDSEVRVLMPSIVLISSSRTSVTSFSTTSGSAPGSVVATLTIGKSMSGSSRTGSFV
jgi:hypothetical protein